MTIGNTIIAGNTKNSVPSDLLITELGPSDQISAGYNFIGDVGGYTAAFNQPGDQTGGGGNPILDPLLAPLSGNGGATPTRALLPGSPAIDKGKSLAVITDQRGLLRPFDNPSIPNAAGGDGADIGAFEMQVAPTAANASVSGRVLTLDGRGVNNAVVTVTDAGGIVRSARTGSFGNFHFADVAAGQTYVVSVVSKRYTFAPQVVSVTEDVADLIFTAAPEFIRGIK